MLGHDLVTVLRRSGEQVTGLARAELDVTDGAAVAVGRRLCTSRPTTCSAGPAGGRMRKMMPLLRVPLTAARSSPGSRPCSASVRTRLRGADRLVVRGTRAQLRGDGPARRRAADRGRGHRPDRAANLDGRCRWADLRARLLGRGTGHLPCDQLRWDLMVRAGQRGLPAAGGRPGPGTADCRRCLSAARGPPRVQRSRPRSESGRDRADQRLAGGAAAGLARTRDVSSQLLGGGPATMNAWPSPSARKTARLPSSSSCTAAQRVTGRTDPKVDDNVQRIAPWTQVTYFA